MIDLDRGDLDRILPAARGTADWDDVLSRSRAARRSRRQRTIVLAVAALAVAVGSASAIGSVREFILDRGFTGLPPEGATPSAPESGELVAHWEGFSATAPRTIVRAWLYADGRIVWDRRSHGAPTGTPEGANELTSGYLEQRLTPEGVELVRSAVVELFDLSRALLVTVPAHDGWPPPPAPGRSLALFVPEGSDFSGSGSVEVPDGERLVRLGWLGIGGNERERAFVREHNEGTIATPEQLSALRRVDALFTDPASGLPASAWAVREVRAYVPSHYAVCIDTSPPKDAAHLLSLLPARAADLLRDKSRTRRGGEVLEAREGGRVVALGRSVTYCFKVETEEAHEVADALSGLEPEPGWRQFGLAYRVAEAVNRLNPTRLWFEPYFPHGRFTFSGPFG